MPKGLITWSAFILRKLRAVGTTRLYSWFWFMKVFLLIFLVHCLCSYSSSFTLVIILCVSSRAVKIISLVVLTVSDSFQRTQFSVGCGANCLYNQAPTDKEIADAATKSSSHDEASSVVSNTVYVHYIIFIFSTHQISHSFMGHFCQCIFKIWPTVLFVLRLLYPWNPQLFV